MHSCHFPATRRDKEQRWDFESITVKFSSSQLNGSISSRENFIKASWAGLLYNYVRNEAILFAVLGKAEANDVPLSQASNSPQNISVLRYLLDPFQPLAHIRPQAEFTSTPRELLESKVNSAVYFVGNGPRQFQPEGFDTSFEELISHGAPFDLILEVQELQPFVEVNLKYRSSTVSKLYAQSIAESLQKTFEAIVSGQSTISLRESILNKQKETMIRWNPQEPYHHLTCMHHLVEATCRISPFSEAVCAWDGSLNYSELDVLSSIAARKLATAGVKQGIHVPFAYEKSLWTVVVTLGILKAGASFVPLDPQHPDSRIKEILATTEAKLIVTSDLFAAKYRALANVVVISAKTMTIPSAEESHSPFFSVTVRPEDPIFVLFTSGSTGKPKGMVLSHGAICTHAVSHGEIMNYRGRRVLQFAAHVFDVAIMDIFTTLIFGGCVCIPSEEERRGDIIRAINNLKANHAILTPSFAKLIKPSEVPKLTTLAIGGEALPEESLREWLKSISVIQIYGPAEVGICLTMNMSSDTKTETVGYPLPNCSCWLVDPEDPDVLVPIGAVGELLVSSPSLAMGYLKNESKTRASFISAPVWANGIFQKDTRFFRTGDLLRYNTHLFDGSYDFVGRKDSQIKLRGQLIEPAEVEFHLSSLPDVAVCMVARPTEGCFAGRLVAIVEMKSPFSSQVRNEPIALTDTQTLHLHTVQEHISRLLPSYMIPNVCLVIKRMPFVPSLKIDRRRVEAWLMDMKTDPFESSATTSKVAGLDLLNKSESTASKLSLTIAEIVAASDTPLRSRLENHNFLLQSVGIDSIQMTSLSIYLQRTFGSKISLDRLIDHNMSVRRLASLVDSHEEFVGRETQSTFNVFLEAETIHRGLLQAIEDAHLNSFDGQNIFELPALKNVFLTGASGYLGSAILKQLMETDHITVCALVRCSDNVAGLERLKVPARKAGWWKDEYKSRIKIWQGDLDHPDFCLDPTHWNQLRGKSEDAESHVHAIIHNGAKVHYTTSYETLKPTNVCPTATLLETTALSANILNFSFVSGGQLPDDLSLEHNDEVDVEMNGYAKTKSVSELLVRKCSASDLFHGKKLHIVKPGYIIGSPRNGMANTTDYIWRLIASCVELRIFNRDTASQWLFVADVEHVAGLVVHSMDMRADETLRVLDGLTFSDVWGILRNDFGYVMKGVSGDVWLRRIRSEIRSCGEGHRLFPLLHMLEGDIGRTDPGGSISKLAGNTQRVMEAVRSNVRYLIEVGFLPKQP
ncbi:hypothetical protein HYFRA_00002206 [Hymenoscyphus fraxineus]|uniref:Carrier domain-containing protein n=1 Tax=Hymenoscyphus fraxineus TaxID=746836 RepID=A0A9N9KP66_9HELO|nr:hypothetical protein HYFRA_00002206 [Hymenoscyphus fraxineus]